jgi:hypothetical protein
MIGNVFKHLARAGLTDAELLRHLFGPPVPHVSKHRQFDKDGKHIRGKCIINDNSGIKKRMRAWRREATA